MDGLESKENHDKLFQVSQKRSPKVSFNSSLKFGRPLETNHAFSGGRHQTSMETNHP